MTNHLKKIHIKWVDSVSTEGWVNNHKDSNLNCETVGFYVSETKDRVKVALNKSHVSDNSYGHYVEIPKGAIKSRRWLK